MPYDYWWNETAMVGGTSTVSSGVEDSDGNLSLSYAPNITGVSTLELTILDALGTRVSSEASFLVIPVVAARIAATGPANASAVAGGAVALSYEALDTLGELVPGFLGPVSISVGGAGNGTVWLNGSAFGSINRSANGTFVPPPGAWRSGFLNLTLAVARSGELVVTIAAPPGIVGPPDLRIAVAPDEHDERLSLRGIAHPGIRTNATLYEISDRFGNPIPYGYVVVRTVIGSSINPVYSPILATPNGSFVWVNYSVTGSGAATVYVLSEFDQELLPAISLAALPVPPPYADYAAIAAAVGAAAVVAGALQRRRARRSPTAEEEARAAEDALKRLAEGRAHILAHVSDAPVALEDLGAGWSGSTPPDPAELAEWVGALVAEGLLDASVGPDGRAEFRRAAPKSPPAGPRVEFDPKALDEALARTERDSGGDEAGPLDP